jgi:hypothetical protein
MAFSLRTDTPNVIVPVVRIKPLRVLKMILTMFCSACAPSFASSEPVLVRYLLNRDLRVHPRHLNVSVSLHAFKRSRLVRQAGLTGMMHTSGGSHTYAEIAFPPFNFVMSTNSEPPDERMTNITWFKHHTLDEVTHVPLRLHNLAVTTAWPGHYT